MDSRLRGNDARYWKPETCYMGEGKKRAPEGARNS